MNTAIIEGKGMTTIRPASGECVITYHDSDGRLIIKIFENEENYRQWRIYMDCGFDVKVIKAAT